MFGRETLGVKIQVSKGNSGTSRLQQHVANKATCSALRGLRFRDEGLDNCICGLSEEKIMVTNVNLVWDTDSPALKLPVSLQAINKGGLHPMGRRWWGEGLGA